MHLSQWHPEKFVAVLARHLAGLGLRLPSEKTNSMIASLLIHRSGQNMDDFQKHDLFVKVKAQMKKHLSCLDVKATNHLPYVTMLPDDPAEFSPEWQAVGFQDEARCEPTPTLLLIQQGVRERLPTLQSLSSGASSSSRTPLTIGVPAAMHRSKSFDGLEKDINLQLLNRPPARPMLALPPAPAPSLALPAPATSSALPRDPVPSLASEVPPAPAPSPSVASLALPAPASPREDAFCELAKAEAKPTSENEVPGDRPGPSIEAVAEELRKKMEVDKEAKQREPQIFKRPAGKQTMTMKRPSAPPKKKTCPQGVKGSEKVKGHGPMDGRPAKPLKPPWANKRYPDGCPKCRWKPGCTPSCFRYRGQW